MGPSKTLCAVCGLIVGSAAAAAAAEEGGYLQFERTGGVSAVWVIGAMAAAIVALIVVFQVYNRLTRPKAKAPAKSVKQKRKSEFQKHASKLGFKIAEIKTLRLIANKIDPDDPDSLLTTDAGRERMAADVWERTKRRQREIAFLEGIQEKLSLMRERGLRERATIRVETDLAVWIVKKDSVDTDDEESEDEELFEDAEQVSGRLLNLSEGGAAVSADIDVASNDVVEMWSADPDIWIPPVPAGVLQVERSEEGDQPVLHLHFIDPPLAELRIALQALQRAP